MIRPFGLHLLQNPHCAAQYDDGQFSILAKARTQFLLADLEAQNTATNFVPAESFRPFSLNLQYN